MTGLSKTSPLLTEYKTDGLCRILALDGGGAKGFYTLGVLKEIEGMLGCPLYRRFDLVFGTSTGAIIASLIALGYEIDQIHDLYKRHVPSVMAARTAASSKLAKDVFGSRTFEDVKTGIGIVATRWITKQLKALHAQALTQGPDRFGVLFQEGVHGP